MICKECGADVSSTEVFCPNCGAPLRVTADYDYIQAEIGVKVDQFLQDDPADHLDTPSAEETVLRPEITSQPSEEELAKTVRLGREPVLTIIGEKSDPKEEKLRTEPKPQTARQDARSQQRRKEATENTLALTRTLYVKDSIFGDEDAPDPDEEERKAEALRKQRNRKQAAEAEAEAEAEREKKKKKKRTILIVVIAVIVVLGAAAGILLATSGNKEEPPASPSDVISCSVEDGGSYTTPLEVTLWSEHDYRIVFTLDGSEPGITSGTKYGQPIVFTNSDVKKKKTEIVLTAYSYNNSVKAGEIKVTFTLKRSSLAEPVFDLGSGDYYEPAFITISSEPGSTVYYTYDGSTPSEASTKYTGPIEMKRGNYVLSAIAVDESGVTSKVASAVYNLMIPANISYEEAEMIVMEQLLEEELIDNDEPDENGYFPVPGGGQRRIINGGEALVNNSNYYVVQVDYMNDGSSVQATTYYGVDDQTGDVVRLNRSGMNFVMG